MIAKFVHRRLEIIAFGTGFALMAYELAAARILAPMLGSSIYVWTSVIGTIIAALSLGFVIGGKLSDNRKQSLDVAKILLIAACAATLTIISYQNILDWVVVNFNDQRVQGVMAALLLFAPTSFSIGLTSPYLAKLRIRSLSETGRSIASLDACNALGGIVGTFMTGFVLFGYVGSRETIVMVVALLIILSWLLMPSRQVIARAIASVIVLLVAWSSTHDASGVVKIDTPSAHYEVISGLYNNDYVTGLITGPGGIQSAVYASGRDELVFWYTQEMARLTIQRQPKSVLMLGGGAFTLPEHLSGRLPEGAKIDVVEIDPELENISKKYFGYSSPENVHLFFEDARTYVNETDRKYDVILVDVYGDAMIPFSLMTVEYGEALSSLLSDDGIVIMNLIAGPAGACKDLMDAMNAAYGRNLQHIQHKVNPESIGMPRANHIMLYSRRPLQQSGYTQATFSPNSAYTDNFAPAERLYFDCQQQRSV